ncbi:MAG TPA: S53 family peptidase [Nocardioidaceae bacterium]|nr:S53 family peptidase [Nocardioidaceae bacterium]
MKRHLVPRSVGGRLACAAAAVGLVSAMVGMAPAASARGLNHSNIVYHVSPHVQLFHRGSATPAAGLPAPSVCEANYGFACYTPQLMRSAYNIPDSWTGAGQTIVIVDAYGSPTVRSDLHIFDQMFGLPDPTLNVFCPDGCPKTGSAHKGQPVGWAEETSLDVQWSHAIAPDATIDLVVASNNYGNALNTAERFAVQHHLGNVMSMSFSSGEAFIAGGGNNLQMLQAHRIYEQAAAQGMSVFASAGDDGGSNGGTTPSAGYPATDPLVTGVGGTDLFMSDSGAYQSETVWNDADPSLCPFGCTAGVFGATGGAPSVIWPAPSYMQAVTGQSMKGSSDVSYNASVYTAVMVYIGFLGPNSGLYFFGGTSEGSPQWAAITALANQQAGHSLGNLNPGLYAIGANAGQYAADFHDVTVGNNAEDGPGSGFDAATGWDFPTGLGSPNVQNLVGTLVSGG